MGLKATNKATKKPTTSVLCFLKNSTKPVNNSISLVKAGNTTLEKSRIKALKISFKSKKALLKFFDISKSSFVAIPKLFCLSISFSNSFPPSAKAKVKLLSKPKDSAIAFLCCLL